MRRGVADRLREEQQHDPRIAEVCAAARDAQQEKGVPRLCTDRLSRAQGAIDGEEADGERPKVWAEGRREDEEHAA